MLDGGRTAEVSCESPTHTINPLGYRDHPGSASRSRRPRHGNDFLSCAPPSRSPTPAQRGNRSASNFSVGHWDNGGRHPGDRSDSDGIPARQTPSAAATETSRDCVRLRWSLRRGTLLYEWRTGRCLIALASTLGHAGAFGRWCPLCIPRVRTPARPHIQPDCCPLRSVAPARREVIPKIKTWRCCAAGGPGLHPRGLCTRCRASWETEWCRRASRLRGWRGRSGHRSSDRCQCRDRV